MLKGIQYIKINRVLVNENVSQASAQLACQ